MFNVLKTALIANLLILPQTQTYSFNFDITQKTNSFHVCDFSQQDVPVARFIFLLSGNNTQL